MKAAGTALVVVTAAACLTALGLSIYPGVLNDLLFVALFFACLAIPIGGISGLVVVIVLARSGALKGVRMPWSRLGLSLLILLFTFLLLAFYVPRRFAFAAARPTFMQLVPQATPSEFGGTSLHQRCGVYTVDEYAADPRGGVYFRTHRGQDGIGPNVMSYGFAFKPNRLGTPFGAAEYTTFHWATTGIGSGRRTTRIDPADFNLFGRCKMHRHRPPHRHRPACPSRLQR